MMHPIRGCLLQRVRLPTPPIHHSAKGKHTFFAGLQLISSEPAGWADERNHGKAWMNTLRLAGPLVACLGVFWTQKAIDQKGGLLDIQPERLYVTFGETLKKLSCGHSGLLADIYWMRAVQYYGGKRIDNSKDFNLLGPLVGIATTPDPRLVHVYRFGAIFLSERETGANQPQEAISLLNKGIQHNPGRWELYQDPGLVYYSYLKDFNRAAEVFLTGSQLPGAPEWMRTFAADLLARGGDRHAAQFLWRQVYESSGNPRIRENAAEHLMGLAASGDIEALQQWVSEVEKERGIRVPEFDSLVRLGLLKAVPLDPKGFPYVIDPQSGKVGFSPHSTVHRY